MALLRVLPVGFEIDDIVDGVGEPGDHAKDKKGCQNAQYRRSLKELTVKYQAGENDKIFRPLTRAKRFQHNLQHMVYLTISVGWMKINGDGDVEKLSCGA